MELNIDTQKIRETKKNIEQNINQLESLYEEMFDRLYKMPNTSSEWVGPSAIKYVNALKNEEKEYKLFILDLKSFSNYLENVADEYESLANTIRR